MKKIFTAFVFFLSINSFVFANSSEEGVISRGCHVLAQGYADAMGGEAEYYAYNYLGAYYSCEALDQLEEEMEEIEELR